jgi:hypothetical protein
MVEEQAARPSAVSRALLTVAVVVVPAAVTFPLVARFSRGIFAWDYPPLARSGVVPGDHLVNYYRFWLFSDDLSHRVLRLHDPYAFALVGPAHDAPLGWIFGPVFSLVNRIAGGVAAYNTLVLLAIALGIVFGYLWLRALDVPPVAAVVGAVAIALFPAAYARLTVHIKAFFFWLMPVALYLVERARRSTTRRSAYLWAAGAGLAATALITVVEPETAVYFWPVLLLYAVGRSRREVWLGLGTGLVLSGLYVAWFYASVIGPSVNSSGRALSSLVGYSPSLGDLFTRDYHPIQIEHYIWPGVAGFVAIIGCVRLWRSRAPLGAKLIVVTAPLVVVAAMGPKAPLVGRLYRVLFEHVGPLRVVQTPGRAMFVLGPAVGLGVAFALARLVDRRWGWALALAAMAVFVVDARAVTWRQSRPLPASVVAAAADAKGIVDLPITNGLDYLGGVYDYGITAVPARRVGGESPFVTKRQIDGWVPLLSLSSGAVDPAAVDATCRIGVTHVFLWEDMFGRHDLPKDAAPVVAALRASPRFQLLAADKGIDVFRLRC